MNLTGAQREAISARGNVLVAAGAGTGKTRTLVERCLACLLQEQPRASIDEILMVTFTEAAAAEMRARVRQRLEQESNRDGDPGRWQEQLALFESAHFGTLHSFCLQLVRQHFYQLELDPQLAVLPEHEARLLANETLDDLLQAHYQDAEGPGKAVRRLIRNQGRGSDRPIRNLVLRLHHYAQTLPDPVGWLEAQLKLFAAAEPITWRGWWAEAIGALPQQWLPTIEQLSPMNGVAAQCAAALRGAVISDDPGRVLAKIESARSGCPSGKKGAWVDALKSFFAETDFLSSLARVPGKPDPMAEDWLWVRDDMTTLLNLCAEFGRAFAQTKRELGMVDFHDLEQYALRLLWDSAAGQPTPIAQHWRQKLRFIFVDEYQDINAAQDQIIHALAREGPGANRFLVGDVKQSIYRFRLANPRIFQDYAERWAGPPGAVVPLLDNFRSKQGLLDFVNSVFGLLMSRQLGGADYKSEAALRFGAPEERVLLSTAHDSGPSAELHLLLKGNDELPQEGDEESEGLAEIYDLREAEREARLVALRLRELHRQHLPVWDIEQARFRPVEWKDMAILLRAPANKVESYAKEFARLELPLQIDRPGFYESVEISDLLSLLQILDNPLQDLPLLAVLHSPLVGLTIDELAEIRLTALKTRFWAALIRWHRTSAVPGRNGDAPAQSSPPPAIQAASQARDKVGAFLERFGRWRRLARQASLSRCLEVVLAETHYSHWALTQSRGPQRHANIQRLITLAQEFDRFQRQGLFRFLNFIEAQKEIQAEPEVGASATANAVRLMSIHQSKGLEFPVVVVADLAKPFNTVDLRSQIILDEQFGLCPQVKPPHTGRHYPSIASWRARRRQMGELLGEELRLLYVAMTRARDRLVLSGSVSRRKLDELWSQPRMPTRELLVTARSYTDWLGRWFALNGGEEVGTAANGQTALLNWRIHEAADLIEDQAEPQPDPAQPPASDTIDFKSACWPKVRTRIAWQYPFKAATCLPAKSSVSALRREAGDSIEEAALFAQIRRQPRGFNPTPVSAGELSAADIGRAHHEFLQLLSLTRTESVGALAEQARLLQNQGRLSSEQVKALDFESLAHFWRSDLGRRICSCPDGVRRELPFTARFAAEEVAQLIGRTQESELGSEFVLVQGVADLVVLQPEEIWLVDFKTDHLEAGDLTQRVKVYAPQLRLYSAALSRVYKRPVTQAWLYFLSVRQATSVVPAS